MSDIIGSFDQHLGEMREGPSITQERDHLAKQCAALLEENKQLRKELDFIHTELDKVRRIMREPP